MEEKKSIFPLYETLSILFIPFLIVLFIEFVLRFGMGPTVERISFFSPIYASLIAICSCLWIKKRIIFAFIPMVLFSVIIAIILKGESTVVCKFLYFFISLFILSFFSVIGYAFSKVIKKHGSSYSHYILKFFVGLFIFVCGMLIIHFFSGFLNSQITVVKSLISGIREGLLLGSGVTIVIIMLSQKVD